MLSTISKDDLHNRFNIFTLCHKAKLSLFFSVFISCVHGWDTDIMREGVVFLVVKTMGMFTQNVLDTDIFM